MVGTPKNRLAWAWDNSPIVASASNELCNRTVAPAARAQVSPTCKPCIWNNGRVSSSTSSGRQAQAASRPVTVATMLLWESMAPLQRPVVPEVYSSVHVSSPDKGGESADSCGTASGSRPCTGIRLRLIPAMSARWWVQVLSARINAGWQSPTMCANSDLRYRVLTGTRIAPVCQTARQATTK